MVSSVRPARSFRGTPREANSAPFHPKPTPRISLLRLSKCREAVALASGTGWRKGSTMTSEPSLTASVRAAIAVRVTIRSVWVDE